VTAWSIPTHRSGDEEAWLELIRASWDSGQEFLNRSPSLDAPHVVIEHPHMDSEHNLFFGESWNSIDDERIARTGENRGDIWCLCVHPQHRGRGLGRALLLAGVDWLLSQGMKSAHLAVDGAKDRAKHLYESVGFHAA
jgi:ribosomal protein S18 acetylase RimI-like enzyme